MHKGVLCGVVFVVLAALPAQAQDVDVPGNLTMVDSTATAGNILKGGVPFIHNFGGTSTFIGRNAGNLTMSGVDNTASGASALLSNTTGGFNTASGVNALFSNTTGDSNPASGFSALFSNTTGGFNTASGRDALFSNTDGNFNTASGTGALFSNTTGRDNTASGVTALRNNTTGFDNTASGVNALFSNTTGDSNTASGRDALFSNTDGRFNTASGGGALRDNSTGVRNTAVGVEALLSNSTGSANIAVGMDALRNKTTGNGNIAIGDRAGIDLQAGGSNIYIGNTGGTFESNTIRIGNCLGGIFGCAHSSFFVAGVANTAVAGVQVLISDSGQLGVLASSRRFKDEVRDMGEASAGLRRLRPVSFYYKQAQQGGPRQLQYGLIAEEVAAVYPELVEYSQTGEPFTVRYHLLGAMLLNEVQKQDRQTEEQQQQIHAQAAQIAELKAQRQQRDIEQAAQIAELKGQVAQNADLKARLEAVERLVKDTQTAASRESNYPETLTLSTPVTVNTLFGTATIGR